MAVPAEIRRNSTLVVVAGAVYLLLQAVLAGFARPLGPYERALFGSVATEDLWVVRLAMMVLSSLALIVAFRAWVRPAGKAAWAAAGVFAVSWVAVHFGGEVRPEVLAALACVAAAGSTTRWLVERDRAALVGTAIALLVATALMPAVGIALAIAAAAVVVVWARTGGGPVLTALGVGLIAGRLLAALLRAGAAGDRVADVEAGGGAWAQQLRDLPALLEPALSSAGAAGVWRTAIGAVILAALVVLAIVWWRWPHRRNAARTGVAVAAALFLAGVFTTHPAPTAFLPAYALLTIAVGGGLLASWRAARDTGWFLATAGYVALVLAFAGWQATVAAVQSNG